MTREEAKKMLPIIKAWAEGRDVEYNYDGKWERIVGDYIELDVPAEWYRVVISIPKRNMRNLMRRKKHTVSLCGRTAMRTRMAVSCMRTRMSLGRTRSRTAACDYPSKHENLLSIAVNSL